MSKYVIPRIDEPIMMPNGTMSLSWYLYLAQGGSGGGGGGGGDDKNAFRPPMLSFMWSDHQLNDAQWLRADTFSWQTGAVYQAAYAHLVLDVEEKTLQSETIDGTTIQFYLADDGHKICPASEESNVMAIYNATGVAWYYIVDTENQRFKLPRTQFGFTGLRDSVGNYIEAGVPNITGSFDAATFAGTTRGTGAFTGATAPYNWAIRGTYTQGYGGHYPFDASNSNSIYGNSDTVQPKATEMYLYFYVGNFTQTALKNTAGLNTELFNGKADTDLSNIGAAGQQVITKLVIPDWSAGVDITPPTQNNQYTCPYDGVYVACLIHGSNNNQSFLVVNGTQSANCASQSDSKNANRQSSCVYLHQGDVIYWTQSISSGTVYSSTYYPLTGVTND